MMRLQIGFLRYLLRRHPLLSAVLAILLLGAGWFAYGFVQEARYFADPAHRNQKLEPWMSPRYVGKSWDLPPETIVRVMQLQPDHRQRTLAEVTAHLGISLPQLEERVRAAKERRQQSPVRSASPRIPAF